MSRQALRAVLQALLLLSPLPFGCVGGVWQPLCYLLFALFALLAFLGPQAPLQFLYQRPVRALAWAFFALVALQLLPLPMFLLQAISPAAAGTLRELSGTLPAFHPLSLIPGETLLALARFLVYAVFFLALLRVDWNRGDPSLHFNGRGMSHVSNGTFTICHRAPLHSHGKLVISVQGRVRGERLGQACPLS